MLQRMIQNQCLTELQTIYQNIKPSIGAIGENTVESLTSIKVALNEQLSAERCRYYNEMLDGIILGLNQFSGEPNEKVREEILKMCRDILKYVYAELSAESEIDKRKVIFFLPYKASMWDSLESIWQAAVEDSEHCIAYVMPIPYADRKPDQTVAQWHCEADLFPKYVPVLDWKSINLEACHPDIIFIHNPYDNRNAVTSVDSQYYSEELKKCTDKLVYVPYYVTKEIEPGDKDLEEDIAHLITAQGVLNADLVVVQSEKIRQVYINVLSRHTNQGAEYWRKHVIGLGSPKYDKVLSTRREDLTIPKEWLKVIRKPDGSFKKIVFFNTGLTPMLKHMAKLLDKIEDNLKIFKQRRDEIALLWRPHPLISATLAGMLPDLQARYDTILKKYKREGWGIFDDSADLNRAMALSDAYFGDGSSVELLYEVTGKPIMYHNVAVTAKEYPEIVRDNPLDLFKFNCFYRENSIIWCTTFCDPNLYKIDLETKKVEIVTNILEPDDQLDAFIFIKPYKDSFIFIQSTTRLLILMNRQTFHKEKFEIPAANPRILRLTQKFANAVVHGDNVYIFGFNYIGIVKFNLITKKFTVIDSFLKGLKITNHNEVLSIYNYIEVGDTIYLPFNNANAVLEFSTLNDTATIHYVGDENQRYVSGAFDGQNIWLVPRNGLTGSVVKWNPAKNETLQFADYLEKDKRSNNKLAFDRAFRLDNFIIVTSYFGKYNLKIDFTTDSFDSFANFFKGYLFLSDKFFCLHTDGDNICCFDGLNFLKYDINSGAVESTQVQLSQDIIDDNRRRLPEKLNFIFKERYDGKSTKQMERRKLPLRLFLDALSTLL